MKVLLTGADGFLGSSIMKKLLDNGYKVRGFLQKGRNHKVIEGLDYEPVYGDLLNISDIKRAVEDCDIIIHTAAITNIWPTKSKISWKINYDAVKILVETAIDNKIKRFIHVGTANSFGFGTKDIGGNEDTPYNCSKYGLDYMDSKKAAQDYLLDLHKKSNFPVVIINPSFMIGECDTKPGTGEMIISIAKGKLSFYAPGGRSVTYVGDVAQAAVNAISLGKTGECYIASGTNMDYKELFTMIAKTANVKAPKIKAPTFACVIAGALFELISKLTKKKPALTIAMARISADGHYYDNTKARNELNMPSTLPEIAIKKSYNWLKENNYL